MILYTEVSSEAIFPGTGEEHKPLQEIQVGGVMMQVEPLADRQARIVRLISPNPADYLNPRYAPGQTISFMPFFGG